MLVALLNVALRALSLVGRFVLTLFLAKQAGFETLATFGIISAAVAMAPAFLSFGMHYSLNRDLISLSRQNAFLLIRDRIYLHIIFFLLLVFLYLIGDVVIGRDIFHGIFLGNHLEFILVALLVFFEVVGNELHLALVNKRKSNFASVVQFIRNASWIFPLMIYSLVFDVDILLSILIFWVISSAFSLLLIFVRFSKFISISDFLKAHNFRYFFHKSTVSLYIYIGDMANVGFQYGDRFVLNAILGAKTTGLYIFFSTIASGVQQLVVAGFVQPSLPMLVECVKLHGRKSGEYKLLRISFLKRILYSSGLFAFFSTLALFFAGDLINREEIRDHDLFGAFVIFAVVVKCVYDALGYSLYSAGFDRELVFSNLFLAFFSLVLNIFLTKIFGYFGVVLVLYLMPLIFIVYRFKILNYQSELDK